MRAHQRTAGQGRVQPPLPPGHRARRRGGARRDPRQADAPARALRARRPARLRARVAHRAGAFGRRGADRPGDAPAGSDALACGAAAPVCGAAAHSVLGDAGRGQRGAAARRGRFAQCAMGDAARELDGVEELLFAGDLLRDGEAAHRRLERLLRAPAPADLPDEPRAWTATDRGDRLPRRGPLVAAGVGRASLRRCDAASGGWCWAACTTRATRGSRSSALTRAVPMRRCTRRRVTHERRTARYRRFGRHRGERRRTEYRRAERHRTEYRRAERRPIERRPTERRRGGRAAPAAGGDGAAALRGGLADGGRDA